MSACLETPRVWIGCLACHTAGLLIGSWFDALSCPTEPREFAASVITPRGHLAEQHDELWIFDHEGFGGVLRGECSPVAARHLANIVELAQERSLPVEVLAHWLSDGHDADDPDLLDSLQDADCGHWDSGADYAQELHDDIHADGTQTDVWPFTCIDWSQAWRELQYGGDAYELPAAGGGVHVLRAV